MRLDSNFAISGAAAFAAAALLFPAVSGADSHLESDAKKAGHAIESDTDKAAKDVAEDTKVGAKAAEKDTESMLTVDGKPRPDDPFALKPEGDAAQNEE
jgi:hypothetical protein